MALNSSCSNSLLFSSELTIAIPTFTSEALLLPVLEIFSPEGTTGVDSTVDAGDSETDLSKLDGLFPDDVDGLSSLEGDSGVWGAS